MASGDAVQQIKDRLSIVDVVSSYVELHPAGKNMKGKSPFTPEKTPSFYVSPDRGMYYCFSSSQGGDIFTFVQTMEGVDFKGALKILAEKAGVELVKEDPVKRSQRDAQYDVLEEATVFFENQLRTEIAAQTYLEDRGVTKQTQAKWRLGYAPGPPEHGWRELKTYLESKGRSQAQMNKVGLIKGMDSGKEPYDVFRDRIMFPIFDASGRVVAYSGRILHTDSQSPKYVNSPETEFFNKSEILYGYDKARQGIRTFNFSLIVEGQFDVVLAHQSGYTNTVAVSGTALTSHHVMLLQRLSSNVVLALDADRAGIAAVKKAADIMLPRGMDVKVAHMPEGKDPADIIKEDVGSFKKVVKAAVPIVEYLLHILQETVKDERTMKLKVREEVLPYIARIPNKMDQDHFVQKIAEAIGTTKDAIGFEVERIARLQVSKKEDASSDELHTSPVSVAPHTDLHGRKDQLQKHLAVLSTVVPQNEAAVMQELYKEITTKNIPEILETLSVSEMSQMTFLLEQYCTDTPQRQRREDIIDKLTELSVLLCKEQLRMLRGELKKAEASHDEERIRDIIQQISVMQAQLTIEYSTERFV